MIQCRVPVMVVFIFVSGGVPMAGASRDQPFYYNLQPLLKPNTVGHRRRNMSFN